MAAKRLMNIAAHLASPQSNPTQIAGQKDSAVDWTTAEIPAYDALPAFKTLPGCAWGVWGAEDQLGTVNLLTDAVVKDAASKEIKTGKSVSLNWPLNFPAKPLFERKSPEINMKLRMPESSGVRDDEIHMNTQSGTQWDGMRHFPILDYGVFYNKFSQFILAPLDSCEPICSIPGSSLPHGIVPLPNPHEIDPAHARIGIQNWAAHGICGRGVLLDLVSYQTSLSPNKTLPYDPWSTHQISVQELEACAKAQGVKFQRGDILILRMGFIKKYYEASQGERDDLQTGPETFAGIERSEEMKRFLWNNHFAAVASDQPTLEAWPVPKGTTHMHQTILGLWGMPIGEFFDLEKLSEICAETGRYTFFFSSWPLNIIGGCASPPNAAVRGFVFLLPPL
ncbi:Serine/threonine protein kinase PRP4 [Mycena venus]|uniref:Serine/threonine protein kinase PRP4 n=1 Tax=Mycena venus TaxID=2733690 RepID=A0A8H6Y750_9AGAR|nr:Serine/threonine protein kinase PRP4 [Mycena venus]